MAAATLQIECHFRGAWHAAAELTVRETQAGRKSPTQLGYLNDYIVANIDDLGTHDARAIAERFPVGFGTWTYEGWPPFLYDIVPAGAARRWWETRLDASFETEAELDWLLLRNHTRAPVGHLRIAGPPPREKARPFSKDEVLARDVGFLEYAAARGAAIGGATGAGGDAPKVLLAEDVAGNIYPADTIPDHETHHSWFVKWPRGKRTAADRLILVTEHYYATALAELGLDICVGELVADEGRLPSLWLPRFDRHPSVSGLERRAVESLYSLAGITTTGAAVRHQTFLRALRGALSDRDQLEDFPTLVREYVCRDLLDVVVGNSDNHGRNRAIVRGERLVWAPIYDLAPMVLDPAGVTRSTTWEKHEYGGRIDWVAVCDELDAWVPGLDMTGSLRAFADSLRSLPGRLMESGIDEAVMDAPRIYLGDLEETLKRWGLG